MEEMVLNFNGPSDTRLFFFDTETTGLPRNWKAPITDLDNWPRMIQLAWMLCDEAGNECAQATRIIRPDGFYIPPEASEIHGITTERAMEEGIPLADAIDEALPQIEKATSLIAHNISFDEKIFGAECLRLKRPLPYGKKPMRCTMKESTDFCAIPGRYGYKYPNLMELHRKLFKKSFEGAHDALADVRACKASYFELRTRGVMA